MQRRVIERVLPSRDIVIAVAYLVSDDVTTTGVEVFLDTAIDTAGIEGIADTDTADRRLETVIQVSLFVFDKQQSNADW